MTAFLAQSLATLGLSLTLGCAVAGPLDPSASPSDASADVTSGSTSSPPMADKVPLVQRARQLAPVGDPSIANSIAPQPLAARAAMPSPWQGKRLTVPPSDSLARNEQLLPDSVAERRLGATALSRSSMAKSAEAAHGVVAAVHAQPRPELDVLIDAQGREIRPARWIGNAPEPSSANAVQQQNAQVARFASKPYQSVGAVQTASDEGADANDLAMTLVVEDRLYEIGMEKLVDGDRADGLHALSQAAERGHTKAMLQLGMLMEEGRHLPKNEQMAASMYVKASSTGDSVALFRLGLLALEGRGIPQNYRQAFRLFRASGFKGNEYAQYRVALMLKDGLGAEPDPYAAFVWANLAAAGAEGRAGVLREKLASTFSPEQLSALQAISSECASSSLRKCKLTE